ncbi:NEQ026 [Nanoarchaeum equitans Kin4-M]|uniref:NEQ026 n=1 Tax=Nanoarchaeum equitans (strain Kin4-M) TaxID=228908 RepID=Q74MG9_NANEQ|nr:NEQ026 [Nanoarchaeum equitans Kin4-M]
MKTIEIEIVRPVNPVGISFVRYLWGAMAARDREVLERHRKEFSKLVQRLGYTIEEKIGTGKLITGKVVIELDEDDKPLKARVEELKIWEPVKEINEKIEVEL